MSLLLLKAAYPPFLHLMDDLRSINNGQVVNNKTRTKEHKFPWGWEQSCHKSFDAADI